MRLIAVMAAALTVASSASMEDGIRTAHFPQKNGISIGATLAMVQLPPEVIRKTERLMGALGLETAFDLQVIARAPAEAAQGGAGRGA